MKNKKMPILLLVLIVGMVVVGWIGQVADAFNHFWDAVLPIGIAAPFFQHLGCHFR